MEKMFGVSRYLVMVVVLTCLVAAVLLYLSSIFIVAQLVADVFTDVPTSADSGKRLAVRLLKVLDVSLIAVTFQIIAIGLFRLFISASPAERSGFLAALQINNFHDLKVTLLQVAIVILVVLFLEQAVEVGATLETLYLGLAFALVIASAVWAAKSMHAGSSGKFKASQDANSDTHG
ncbi:YqhA family protein [Pseudomonas sp.]|jgi:uncharacterized membrane protein YqhA|uniref:YqhA family protein n=1 Tax=Pseudomonas sp. TaxID=306 RepID=UPI00272A18C2|nr:YqhA family protein [Pseudomonas sp.]